MSTPEVGAGDTLSGVHIALVIIGGTIGIAVFLVSAQIGGSLGLQRAACWKVLFIWCRHCC